MFTGLIQHLGRVARLQPTEFGAALQVDAGGWSHRPAVGDSIAVNGCCLTVAGDPGDGRPMLCFHVIHQTLRHTALGDLKAGDVVNLEHAATPATLLGGHIVQGHVDGVGVVRAVHRAAGEHRVAIELPESLMEYVVEKGSIAVNGVSLTIASTHQSWFEVALIPTTLQLTNLDALVEGARVNIETDYLAKITVSWLRTRMHKTEGLVSDLTRPSGLGSH